MSCPPISGLILDKASKKALEEIKRKNNTLKLLGPLLTAGVFSNIFTKNTLPVAAFNIKQTDWELYAKSMNSLPTIQRAVINKDIDLMILHYHLNTYDHKHVQFWKGLRNGCK